MKLKKLLIIILVAALLAVYYIFGMDYRTLRHDNAVLASQISGAAQQRALLSPPPTDLAQRRAAVRDALEKEKNTFPADNNTTLLVNAVLKLAEAAGVKAVPLITQAWAMESINQTVYPVFRLNLTSKGTLAQLSDFLGRLESGDLTTLVISNMKVDFVTGPPGDRGDTTGLIDVEATLDIAVYARPSVTIPLDKVESQ